jgi:hypothetical protein
VRWREYRFDIARKLGIDLTAHGAAKEGLPPGVKQSPRG